jgi:hypothetical protein
MQVMMQTIMLVQEMMQTTMQEMMQTTMLVQEMM